MTWLKNRRRDKLLAGALAAMPVVVVVWGALGARSRLAGRGDAAAGLGSRHKGRVATPV